ncbi:riboflavin synthase subunit alpha [Buchnera aphidicola]|uniref:Riboflavin synthase n=1 Tax=Buchnera aphidicola (Stegophylla sp.) TaxID=2315800 RepID=A0A4D6YA38_9GAMM|nr:riboflavin synthase subunit alpha [Buchnera aphidicola (Stegophylla sp.)]QCI26269.1 riboflavin synthase subunit alpha [Buchnera aphidicola (Stegophylla sp.)]
MFTGIIQGIAIVSSIKKKYQFFTYNMKFPNYLTLNLNIGASVSNNGCCLTVTKIHNHHVYFDVIQETLIKTNLSLLSVGSKINVERSLKFGDEVGGHLLTGHIIGTAKICNIIHTNNNRKIFFQVQDVWKKYIFLKGFIAIDGISLTVSDIKNNIFCVCFIPETLCNTNISMKVIGDIVNIEVDYYTQIIIDRLEKLNFNHIIH